MFLHRRWRGWAAATLHLHVRYCITAPRRPILSLVRRIHAKHTLLGSMWTALADLTYRPLLKCHQGCIMHTHLPRRLQQDIRLQVLWLHRARHRLYIRQRGCRRLRSCLCSLSMRMGIHLTALMLRITLRHRRGLGRIVEARSSGMHSSPMYTAMGGGRIRILHLIVRLRLLHLHRLLRLPQARSHYNHT